MVESLGLRYDSVDSAYLDCLNDNLAVLLLHAGVADVRTPFACQWYFDVDLASPAPMITVEHVPTEALIRQQTGCALEWHEFERDSFTTTCESFVRDNQPVLIFGDAYFMPWLPYFGREHMEHTFIVDGVSADQRLLHLVDAYANKTEWGEASPTETYLPALALARIVQSLDTARSGAFLLVKQAEQPATIDWAALLRSNAAQIRAQLHDKARLSVFSQQYARTIADVAAIKQFVLDCWLIARSRALHGRWLADVARDQPDLLDAAFVETFAQDVVAPWQRVNEFAYILFRRVSQGRAAPDACFRMIEQTLQPNEVRVAELLAERLRST
jgi:hypothetical protein